MIQQPDRIVQMVLFTLSALAGWACSKEISQPAPATRPVRVYQVASVDPARRLVLAGVAKAGIESRLSFRVAGTVEALAIKVGDRVVQGTLLARLDATDHELAVEQSAASLAQTRAGLRQAEADYDRTRALYENNNASKAELDAGRASAESASAQVEVAGKALAQARRQLAYTRLVSPMAGAVAATFVEVNETVSAGQAVLQLTADAPPEVEIRVPEIQIARITAGQSAEVTFDALPGQTIAATVTEVGVSAVGAAAFPVTLRIDQDGDAIRSGMAAEVSLRVGDASGNAQAAIFVPLVAVGEDQHGRFVFVLEGDGGESATVHRRPVEVGDLDERGLRILAGLEAGEQVVTAGVRRLIDGMQVRALGAGDGL